MKYKGRILVANVAIWIICLVAEKSLAWASMSLYHDTHWDITKDVLNNHLRDETLDLERDFPDLLMFADQLRNGSNHESHNLPDGKATDWWMPKEAEVDLWFTAGRTFEPAMKPEEGEVGSVEYGARWAYTNYSFQSAYTRIGYELHLVQDTFVPAHENYCFHGIPVTNFDTLEVVAGSHHFYARTTTPWSYPYVHHDGTTTFQYWLSDDMDDDDRDDEACWDDDWDLAWFPIEDGPEAYGVPNTDWGTYGQPGVYYEWFSNIPKLSEYLPGRNEGTDYFNNIPQVSIIEEQLQDSYDETLRLMIKRSIELPPLIPDDETHGKPSIDLDIFGPNKTVGIVFKAYENRKPRVFVSVLAGTAAIVDRYSGTIWDGGANATKDLEPSTPLPWGSFIWCHWNGTTSTGQIDDGTHEITMQIKDQDNKFSEKRTRSVKFDKTKPIGTNIVFNCYPKNSSF